ncbi:hypothetical protein [Salinicoccus halitifaciens]|uniref:Membrane protein YhiD involved in acid resistance n=1 Tax=Salinicoccus halitifaciens TaxID=1073415 RepID=A0ABV2E6I6_9STAP|nr:hypothetical protein [Salinicoccus halitifaciens]MCD2137184.1 hypothetical protein [Salinicoccus halitifaciens]
MYELMIALTPATISAIVTVMVMGNKNKTKLELAEKQYAREIEKYKVELEKQEAKHKHELEIKDKEHRHEKERIEFQSTVQSKSNSDTQINELAMKVFTGEISFDEIERLAEKTKKTQYNKPKNRKSRRRK